MALSSAWPLDGSFTQSESLFRRFFVATGSRLTSTESRTVARAKQLEAEERAQARRETASHAEDGFSDDPDDNGGHPGGAPDDISLFENATDGLDYRDEFTDDDIDAFRLGNSGDEEQIIGMADKQNTP